MENDKREYKERKAFDKQIFYFNDKGQLVVESNKGVWVDGEKFVKMYGDFVCNAKTLGIVISKFKGCSAIAKDIRLVGAFNTPFVCETIVNPTEEDNTLIDELKNVTMQRDGLIDKKNAYRKAIESFNRLPWWKRMLKKIEVK